MPHHFSLRKSTLVSYPCSLPTLQGTIPRGVQNPGNSLQEYPNRFKIDMHVKESCPIDFCRPLIFTSSVMEIQQCKVSPRFPLESHLLGRMEALQGLRIERETWTYFALLYLHNGRGKNQRSTEINRTGLLYVHIDFEIFLQGATWILNPSGYCALQRRQGARVRHQSRFS